VTAGSEEQLIKNLINGRMKWR